MMDFAQAYLPPRWDLILKGYKLLGDLALRHKPSHVRRAFRRYVRAMREATGRFEADIAGGETPTPGFAGRSPRREDSLNGPRRRKPFFGEEFIVVNSYVASASLSLRLVGRSKGGVPLTLRRITVGHRPFHFPARTLVTGEALNLRRLCGEEITVADGDLISLYFEASTPSKNERIFLVGKKLEAVDGPSSPYVVLGPC